MQEDQFHLVEIVGHVAIAIIWTECNLPEDNTILACGLVSRIIERRRLISRRFKYDMRRKLPVFYEALVNLDGGVRRVAVGISCAERDQPKDDNAECYCQHFYS